MRNLDKYLSLLDGEVDGLLLTSRYSRHYGAEFDISEGVAVTVSTDALIASMFLLRSYIIPRFDDITLSFVC